MKVKIIISGLSVDPTPNVIDFNLQEKEFRKSVSSSDDLLPFLRFLMVKNWFSTECEEFIRGTQQETKVIALTLNPTPIVFKSFVCSRSVDLILGGEDAKEAEFPHQALLGYRTQDSDEYEFDCGGTLVSEWYVLTAAHCMKRGKPSFVRLGESNLKQRSAQEFNIEIDYIIRHPQHRFKESYHDIALIKLMERVYFSNYVQPACLWDDLNDTISPVIATGFGVTESMI